MAKANNWAINLPRQQVATYTYDSDHAVEAHEGFTLQSGEEAPSRPWVYLTADNYDFEESLLEKVDLRNPNVGQAVQEGFISLAVEFGEEMQQNIQDPIWEWPRVTQRQNGEVVGSPRNIVDQGELLNSYSLRIS